MHLYISSHIVTYMAVFIHLWHTCILRYRYLCTEMFVKFTFFNQLQWLPFVFSLMVTSETLLYPTDKVLTLLKVSHLVYMVSTLHICFWREILLDKLKQVANLAYLKFLSSKSMRIFMGGSHWTLCCSDLHLEKKVKHNGYKRDNHTGAVLHHVVWCPVGTPLISYVWLFSNVSTVSGVIPPLKSKWSHPNLPLWLYL